VVEFAGIEPKRSLDIPQCLVQRIAPAKPPMIQTGQSLPKRDVRVTSIHPSISGMTSRRGERRKGSFSDMRKCARDVCSYR
jgi:hypothetical protein